MTYPSDLNDAEWLIIEPLLPLDKRVGRPPEVDLRQVLNAIFYRAGNGIKWWAMPIDFPPGKQFTPTIEPGCAWASRNRLIVALVAKGRVQAGRVA